MHEPVTKSHSGTNRRNGQKLILPIFMKTLLKVMGHKSIHLKFCFLLLFYTVSTTTAQTNNDLKSVWENDQVADTVRFNAIHEFYLKNTTSQPDSVIKLSDFHLELAHKKKKNTEKIKALREKSYAYFVKGNAIKAEETLKQAIQIQATLNDQVELARLYTNLASIYLAQSKFIETIRYYNHALKIFEENKEEKLEAAVLGNLGLVYFDVKNIEIAVDYFEKSLVIYTKLNLQDRVGYISLYMGGSDYEKGNYEGAIEHAEKAVKIFESNSDMYAGTDCYTLLAKSYKKINEIDKALFYINKSLAINQQLENRTKVIQNKTFLAELHLESDITKATAIGEEVLVMIDSTTDKNAKASLYNLLYLCYKKNNKIELSHKMYDQYIVYNDSIVKEQSNLELIKEAVNQEFKIKLAKNKQSFEQSEKDLKRNQLIKLVLIVLISLVLVFSIYFYFRQKNISDRKKNEELLEEIKRLKTATTTTPIVAPHEFKLIREKIEQHIKRKLNDTDWSVLNILLKEPDVSNKEIAKRAYLSIDGIGSSLRRMYAYFEIKESKYKKTSLIMEAIKASNR